MKILAIILLLILSACDTSPQLMATPATSCPNPLYEGFGAGVTGGEGQPVYRVTTLANSGTGSLRDAVSIGNRCVVFDVAGTITLSSDLTVKGNNITIDGLSAPAPGITIAKYAVSVVAKSNIIVRGVRVRDVVNDGIRFYEVIGGIADHNSVTGFGDGAIDVTENSRNVTVSWNIMGDGIASHNLANLVAYGSERVTVHHNYYVNTSYRTPYCGYDRDSALPSQIVCDVVNNLAWDYRSCANQARANGYENSVNNYFHGNNTPICFDTGAKVYTTGNYSDGGYNANNGNVSVPFAVDSPVQTQDAITAANLVLASAGARGANFGLDAQDTAYVNLAVLPIVATNTPTVTRTPTLIPPTKTATPTNIPPTATRTPTATPSIVCVTWAKGLNLRETASMKNAGAMGFLNRGATFRPLEIQTNSEGTFAKYGDPGWIAIYLVSSGKTYAVFGICP